MPATAEGETLRMSAAYLISKCDTSAHGKRRGGEYKSRLNNVKSAIAVLRHRIVGMFSGLRIETRDALIPPIHGMDDGRKKFENLVQREVSRRSFARIGAIGGSAHAGLVVRLTEVQPGDGRPGRRC